MGKLAWCVPPVLGVLAFTVTKAWIPAAQVAPEPPVSAGAPLLHADPSVVASAFKRAAKEQEAAAAASARIFPEDDEALKAEFAKLRQRMLSLHASKNWNPYNGLYEHYQQIGVELGRAPSRGHEMDVRDRTRVPGLVMQGWAETDPIGAFKEVASADRDRPCEGELLMKLIEAHRDLVLSSGYLNLTSTMRQVVAADLHLSERVQALNAISTFPEYTIDQMWSEAIKSSAGTLQDALLMSATMMNRRADYLRDVLLEARRRGALDDAWNLVPLDERAEIVEAADAAWDAGSSPVEMESKERWRAMIAKAWGTAP